MRLTFVTIILALVWVSPSQAHLVTKSDPKNDTLKTILAKQTKNLAHVNYVCNRGSNATRRWHCSARSWIKAERRETLQRIAKATKEYVAPYPWLSIAICESSLGSGRPNWSINTGNGFYGGLQFDYGTWHEAQRNLGLERGNSGWYEYAHYAPASSQVRAAMTLPLTRWPVCGAPYR